MRNEKESQEIIFYPDTLEVTQFEMSLNGLIYFEEHFLFSYRVVQFIMGLRPYQNSYDQLLFICVIIFYSLPMILYQVNVFLTNDLIVFIIIIQVFFN